MDHGGKEGAVFNIFNQNFSHLIPSSFSLKETSFKIIYPPIMIKVEKCYIFCNKWKNDIEEGRKKSVETLLPLLINVN